MTEEKTLTNTDIAGAAEAVPDIEVFGDGDAWQLICKASSKAQGWMKSTKALEIPGIGCLVQVTTQQRNPDGSYAVAEAVTYVPNTRIVVTGAQNDGNGEVVTGRALVPIFDVGAFQVLPPAQDEPAATTSMDPAFSETERELI